jgi:myo-inositol 2-dehydrogenase/D-chiro-inositol 1-dehydrogenase
MTKAMKIGLLGAGRIGRIHGLNVAARGDAELVAVTDAMPEAAASLAAATGAKATTTEAITRQPISSKPSMSFVSCR